MAQALNQCVYYSTGSRKLGGDLYFVLAATTRPRYGGAVVCKEIEELDKDVW